MTSTRDNERVLETPYKRLHRIAEARRIRLGLTVRGLEAVGGPSKAWYMKLPNVTAEPSNRMAHALQALDVGLRWPEGTSWRVLTEDRGDWSEDQLAAEERRLIDHLDDFDHFAAIIATRLRTYPPGEVDDKMREILRTVGL